MKRIIRKELITDKESIEYNKNRNQVEKEFGIKKIYVIKSFDISDWRPKYNIIAFNTEKEARKYCLENTVENDIVYCWDEVILGKVAGPYPKKNKDIVIFP